MKVVAFNGSPRSKGNTAILLNTVLDELKNEGIGTELVSLAGKTFPGCRACYKCFETKDGHCVVTGDVVNECIDKMSAADGILLGSPTYFSDVTAGMKALIERAGMTARVPTRRSSDGRSARGWLPCEGPAPSTPSPP